MRAGCSVDLILTSPRAPAAARQVDVGTLRGLQRQLQEVCAPEAEMAAERRRRQLESRFSDSVSVKQMAEESVERVWALRLSVGALLRRAHRWLQSTFHLKDLVQQKCQVTGDAYVEPQGKPVYDSYDAWASQSSMDAVSKQVATLLDVFTTSAIVQHQGTNVNKQTWEAAEEGCMEYLVLEEVTGSNGDLLFDGVRSAIGDKVLVKLKQEQVSIAAAAPPAAAAAGASSTRQAHLATIPKQLNSVTLQSFLESIAAGGDASITFETTKSALSNYEHLLEQLVSFATTNRHRVATEGEPALVREWIGQQKALVDPSAAKENAEKRAKKYVQTAHISTSKYLQEKHRLCERAQSYGNAAGEVAAEFTSERHWCDLAVEGLLPKLKEEVKRHCLSVIGVGGQPPGYGVTGFTSYATLTSMVQKIAFRMGLDPDSDEEKEKEKPEPSGFRQSSSSYGGRGRGRGGAQAFAAEAGRGRGRGSGVSNGPMLCARVQGQTTFRAGDTRELPPKQEVGEQFCMFHWHGERCERGGPPPGGRCRNRHDMTKAQYDASHQDEARVAAGSESGGSASSSLTVPESDLLKSLQEAQKKSELVLMELASNMKSLSARLDAPEVNARQQRAENARQANMATERDGARALAAPSSGWSALEEVDP